MPRSYQVTPDIRDRRRATQRKVVRPNGRQPERESARRRSWSLHLASDVTDSGIQTVSLKGAVTRSAARAPRWNQFVEKRYIEDRGEPLSAPGGLALVARCVVE